MKTENAAGPPVIIVGTGHGCRVHLPALRAAGFDVVALVSRDLAKVRDQAARHGVPHGFDNLADAIASTGAVAVTIASPPHTHADMVRAAVDHGCHVFCEKPFARDTEEAVSLRETVRRAGVMGLLGFQFRVQPEYRVIAEAIAAGVVGQARMATFCQYGGLVADPEAQRPVWWFDAAEGGGWLGAAGSHLFDQAMSWLGPITAVSGALPIVSERVGVAEDSFVIRAETRGGAQVILQQTGGAWGPPASLTRVAGSTGTIWLENGAVWLADRNGSRVLPVPDRYALAPMVPSDDPRKPYLHIELPPTIRIFERWREAIAGNRSSLAGLADFTAGVACMEVIDAVRASVAEGGATIALRQRVNDGGSTF